MTSEQTVLGWEQTLTELQDPEYYSEAVLELRRQQKLHPFVEWRIKSLVAEARPEIHTQAEKWGISNGRIDLAAYVSARCVIHYELIATWRNNHVFRDVTSLLISRADSKLAVLIDTDVDQKVADRFFAAVPDGEIDWLVNSTASWLAGTRP